VAPGIHCSGAAGVRRRIDEGFQFCAMASDLRYMLSGLRGDLVQTGWQPSEPQTVTADDRGAIVRY
jgi:4-hydroxy-2-oxoheptanedioate aldolase